MRTTPHTAIHTKVPNMWSVTCLPSPLSVMLHWWTGGEGTGPRIDPALAKQKAGDATPLVRPSKPQMQTTGDAWLDPWTVHGSNLGSTTR